MDDTWIRILGLVADIIGILGAFIGVWTWSNTQKLKRQQQEEKRRRDTKVRIVLQSGSDQIEIPVKLRRSDLTRAEVQGLLGAIPVKKDIFQKQPRYSLGYLSRAEFMQRINQILETGEDEPLLTISCTEEELQQFDIEKFKA